MNDKAQQALQEYREKVANGEIIKENKTPKHQVISRLEAFFNNMVESYLVKGETGFTVTENEMRLRIWVSGSHHYNNLMDLALMLLLDYGYHVRVLHKDGEYMFKVFWDDYLEITYAIK